MRCGIQLDEIDPAQWALLEAATDDYILSIDGRFQEAAEVLLSAAPTEAALPALPFRTPGEDLLQPGSESIPAKKGYGMANLLNKGYQGQQAVQTWAPTRAAPPEMLLRCLMSPCCSSLAGEA